MKARIITWVWRLVAAAATLMTPQSGAQASPSSSDVVPRPVLLQRSLMGSLGRHLEAVRQQVEAMLCTGGADPDDVLKRMAEGGAAPVEAAALYTPEGGLLARRGFSAVEPWVGETFFADPGSGWLRGRSIVVALSANAAGRAGIVDIRMPLQCEETALFRTRAWGLVRVDLNLLAAAVVQDVPLEPDESVWMAGPDGRVFFRHGSGGAGELRLEGFLAMGGPKSTAMWERMRSEQTGRLMCEGFDGGRFVFRRVLAEWTTMRMGDAPVLLVREMPREDVAVPGAGRTGLWQDGRGARLAIVKDGSNCRLFLQRAPGQPVESAHGRLLEATLSARGTVPSHSFQGEFSEAGQLVLSRYSDHESSGVTREVFVFTKGAFPPSSGPKALERPQLRY